MLSLGQLQRAASAPSRSASVRPSLDVWLIDVVLRREQGADVALEHEVRLLATLDRLGDVRIGRMNQLTDLPTASLLPGR